MALSEGTIPLSDSKTLPGPATSDTFMNARAFMKRVNEEATHAQAPDC